MDKKAEKAARIADDTAFQEFMDYVYENVKDVEVAFEITRKAIKFAGKRGEWIHTLYEKS